MNLTPRGNRLHIALFGKRNCGKSSLINALTGQQAALVSAVAGTTTDPVYQPMEISGIGPCVFIDTAGFDDQGDLGTMRVSQTFKALEKTDVALLVFSDTDIEEEMRWIKLLEDKNIPIIFILNKIDLWNDPELISRQIELQSGKKTILASVRNKIGIEAIKQAIISTQQNEQAELSIIGHLVQPGDRVLLVMPQDAQAPKGRLILPQVQTLRELLDHKCIVVSCTPDYLKQTLDSLCHPPQLIVTDSQVFKEVYLQRPPESKLTSFSVLFARYKGDIDYYIESANHIDNLNENSKILIAEACTHAPLSEDIGREKLPKMLRKRIGEGTQIDIVAGTDFPENLTIYDLIIHCGACMFNRKHVLNRIDKAKEQRVPMTNYGITIAYLNGILDFVDY